MGSGIKRDGSRAHLEFFSSHNQGISYLCCSEFVSWLFLGPW